MNFISADNDGGVIAVMVKSGSMRTFLLFGVYFPFDNHSAIYCNAVSRVLGFIEFVLDDYPGV